MSKISIIILLFFALALATRNTSAQTTEFTYQGQLQNASSPANGNYDFEFLLFDALTAGTQAGSTITKNGVVVANGTFSVNLDFGSNYPGASRFLEIHVRQTGGGGFTPLTPRQAISSSPYAVKSISADTATNATNAVNATTATNALTANNLSGACVGCVMNSQINSIDGSKVTGTVANAAHAVNAANITGNLAGDVTGTQSATVVTAVGGQSAANVANAVQSANAATSNSTANTLVKRDASGNFVAGTITGNLIGNASTATTATTATNAVNATTATNAVSATNSTNAVNFSGVLSGDVSGAQGATTVARLQGRNVAGTVPINGQVLKFNSATNQWEPDTDNTGAGGSGTITGVTPGTGLTGGGAAGNVTLSIANGGVGTTQIADNNVTDAKINSVSGSKVTGVVSNSTSAVNATNFSGNLAGDVSGTQTATVVTTVGGQSAANVASAAQSVNAATSNNTPNTLVKRDASGNFVAGTITGNLIGNASTATTAANATNAVNATTATNATNAANATNAVNATNATNAVNFTGPLAGDVTGNQSTATVTRIRNVTLPAPAVADNGKVLKYKNNGVDPITYEWAADNTSSGGVTTVTASGPLTSSGGTTPNISLTGTIQTANGGTGLNASGASGNLLRSNGSVWSSSALQAADIPAGNANYIQNTASQQSNSNFNISGNGIIGGTLKATGTIESTSGGVKFPDGSTQTKAGLASTGGTMTGPLNLSLPDDQAVTINGSHAGGTWLNIGNTAAGRTWNMISTGSSNGEGPGKLLFRDASANAVRATFDTTGYFGIGTTAPTQKLEVAGNALIYPTADSGGLAIRNRANNNFSQVSFLDDANIYRGYIGYIGANAGLGGRNDTLEFGSNQKHITFRPNETELMRLTTDGKVNVTSSAQDAFNVTGSHVSTSFNLTNTSLGSSWGFTASGLAPSDRYLNITDNSGGGLRAMIDGSGNFGIGPLAPAARLHVQKDGNIGSSWQNSQLRISGASNSNMQLNLGYDTTNNRGVIQAGNAGAIFTSLLLNPFGGRVAIGTSSPSAALHLVTADQQTFSASSNNTGGTWMNLGNTSTNGRTWNLISTGVNNGEQSGKLLIRDENANAVRATFDTNGNLGIGTTSPTAKLDVNGNINANNLPGAKASQTHTTTGTFFGGGNGIYLDSVTINVPASSGTLLISAFVNLVGGYNLTVDFSLQDANNNILASVSEHSSNGSDTVQATASITWVLSDVVAGPITLKTHLKNTNGVALTQYYDHNLSVVYLPKQY